MGILKVIKLTEHIILFLLLCLQINKNKEAKIIIILKFKNLESTFLIVLISIQYRLNNIY